MGVKRAPSDSWESGRSSPIEQHREALAQYKHFTGRISDAFKQFSLIYHQSTRSLPLETGDGSYIDDEDKDDSLSFAQELSHVSLHNISTIKEVLALEINKEPWDDRKYLLEDVIELGSKLSPKKQASKLLINKIVELFWRDLNHPPTSFVTSSLPSRTFDKITIPSGLAKSGTINLKYRSADGSYNNVYNPRLGAANTPYARSVPPVTPQLGALPDAGLLFDVLLKRKHPTKHPNGISSILFYLGTIIIHDLFRTSHTDWSISETSSYLDLSPLYGSSQDEQDKMRTFTGGKLQPDSFSEKRVHGFPPGVAILLIMFNRFHNHVVENLAAINQDNRFDPKSDTQDEDLFQTARLITCGLYCNIILNDYIRVIVNLIQTKSTWKIDPRDEIKGGPPRGTGNQVSAEFNLIYRWHATVSERDEAWINMTYERVFGKPPSDLSVPEMLLQLEKMEKKMPQSPTHHPLVDYEGMRLPRDPQTKKFDDNDLVKIFTESVEDQANAFGAHQVPGCLRAIEIMGVEQARKWQVCTLNEFRKFFNLKQYKKFEEINPDPAVANDLRHLYDTPDQVELYPGLMCEATKKKCNPGSGLMPGFTISRGILSDAIGLIRGDRFFTTDFHPKALTNWGYSEIDSDHTVDYGCCFYKLVFNSFPQHFKRNSIYAHFPLLVPGEMREILEGADDNRPEHHKNYNYDRPSPLPRLIEVNTYEGALNILGQPQKFNVAWREAIVYLMGPEARSFMLAGDDHANKESRQIMDSALYGKSPCQHFDWKGEIKKFYLTKTRDLLKKKQYKHGDTNKIDLIRDVTNMTSVYFCAEMFLLPLKTEEHPYGVFTEQELYLVFVAVFACVFFDADAEKSFDIHTKARGASKVLGEIIELNVKAIQDTSLLSKFMSLVIHRNNRTEKSPLQTYGQKMIERLLFVSKMDAKDLVYGHILGTAGGMVPNQGQQFAELLAFYLFDEEGKRHWPAIVKLAKDDPDGEDPENEDKMLRYVMEGSRLACASAVTRVLNDETAEIPAEHMDNPPHEPAPTRRGSWRGKKAPLAKHATLKQGDKVFVNLWTASRDPYQYPDPNVVSLDRDIENDYICFGWGRHQCLGFDIVKVSLPAMLRVVAGLPHMRPVDGPDGRIKSVPAAVGLPPGTAKGYSKYMTKCYDSYWPFPIGLKVQWKDNWDATPEPQSNGVASEMEHVTIKGHADGHANGTNGHGPHTNGINDTSAKGHSAKDGVNGPASPTKSHRRTASGRRTRTSSR